MNEQDGSRNRPRPPAPGGRLAWVALVLLLVATAGRFFVIETQYRGSAVPVGRMLAAGSGGPAAPAVDRTDLARIAFDAMLLLAATLWLADAAARRADANPACPAWLQLLLRGLILAGAVVLALRAGTGADWQSWANRDAQLVLLDLTAVLAGGFAAMGLARDRRKMHVLLGVLLALGLAMAAKGIYQATFETAERVAAFETDPHQALLDSGIQPGSPEARMFASRIRDWAPVGYFGLSNLFASGLILLLAVAGGMGLDRWARARTDRPEFRRQASRGEIHLPSFMALLTLAVAAVVGGCLLLTQSAGALGAGAIGLVGFLIAWRWGGRLGSRWRLLVTLSLVGFVLAGMGVIGAGLATDRLPGRTLTFRWYYWTGGAKLLAARPITGAGPGNFGDLYLAFRRSQAEESIKDPHNVLVHALGQYGLVAGSLLLATLLGVLVCATRPSKRTGPPEPAGRQTRWAVGLVVVAAVGLLRRVLVPEETGWLVWINTILPMGVLAVGLAVGLYRGGAPDVPGPRTRWAVAAGLIAFFIHNMVTYSLTTPATATLFWVLAGACIGAWGPDRSRAEPTWRALITGRSLPRLTAVALALAATGILALAGGPAVLRWARQQQAVDAYVAGRSGRALELFESAAWADPLDDAAALDTAQVFLSRVRRDAAGVTVSRQLARAAFWARQAVLRDPDSPRNVRKAGTVLLHQAMPDTFQYRRFETASPQARLEQISRRMARGDDGPVLWADRAAALDQLGRTEQAIVALRRAIDRDPRAAVLYNRLGLLQLKKGSFLQAGRSFAQAAEMRKAGAIPETPYFCDGLELWARATRMDPQQTRPRVEYARWLLEAGRSGQAVDQLDAALAVHRRLDPESLMRFDPTELDEIRRLRRWAGYLHYVGGLRARQDEADR